jgi:hypothetical protein
VAKKQKKTSFYKVGTSDGADILASVDVGLGQDGFVTISLDRTAIVSAPAPIGMLRVGTAAEVKGKLLIVEAKVTDVSTMTNKMSVSVMLTGGPSPKLVQQPGEVAAQGDSILFETAVLFRQ